MTEFHLTRMGHTFYEHTVPELVRQLERLNENLERIHNRKENEHDQDLHPPHS